MTYYEIQFEDGYVIRKEVVGSLDLSLETIDFDHGNIEFVHIVVDF